jgi:hypothetical protein
MLAWAKLNQVELEGVEYSISNSMRTIKNLEERIVFVHLCLTLVPTYSSS